MQRLFCQGSGIGFRLGEAHRSRMSHAVGPLIVTDGFEFYGTVVRRVFGPADLYAQVIKTRRHDRVRCV